MSVKSHNIGPEDMSGIHNPERFLLLLLCSTIIILLPTFAQGQQSTDPWIDEMEKAIGLTVGDLEPRFGDLPPTSGPDGSTGTGTDDEATADNEDTDDVVDAERTGPVNPDALDPTDPEVENHIKQWTSTAKPPQNAVPGSNWRYDPFGRVVGSGPGLRTVDSGTHDSVQYGGGTPEASAWHLRKGLDSIDHCTLEEYVVAKLEQKSISHCADRYGAVKDLKGFKLKEAKAAVTAAGFRFDDPVPGTPAKTAKESGTIERQEPGPDQYFKRGQILKLVVHTPYVPGKVTVPDFIGKSLGESKKWLEKNKLKMQPPKAGTPALAKEKSGTIEDQEPDAGTVMKAGGTVVFTVHSKYVDTRKVPKVVGFFAGKAKKLIETAGLKVDPIPADEKPASKELAKTVAHQSPIAGTYVSPETKVSIFIYGPYVKTVTVPDVRELTKEEASRRLQAAGLAMNDKDGGKPPSRNLARTAHKQKPQSGTQMAWDHEVSVWFYGDYVSTKDELIAQKDCSGIIGSRAYWDNRLGKPMCGCFNGLRLNSAENRCIPKQQHENEVCENAYSGSIAKGRNADGKINCDCPQGYTWATGNTHCEKLKPPGEICARDFPGSVFNGTYGANGGPNCDCPQGYTWATGNARCEKLIPQQQICNRDFPGSIARGRTSDGKINCECPQGLKWNLNNSACISYHDFAREWCARNRPGSYTQKLPDGRYKCLCPSGYVFGNNNRCVKKPTRGGGGGETGDCSQCRTYENWLRTNARACGYHGSRLPSICDLDPECIRWNRECNRVKKQLRECLAHCRTGTGRENNRRQVVNCPPGYYPTNEGDCAKEGGGVFGQ